MLSRDTIWKLSLNRELTGDMGGISMSAEEWNDIEGNMNTRLDSMTNQTSRMLFQIISDASANIDLSAHHMPF